LEFLKSNNEMNPDTISKEESASLGKQQDDNTVTTSVNLEYCCALLRAALTEWMPLGVASTSVKTPIASNNEREYYGSETNQMLRDLFDLETAELANDSAVAADVLHQHQERSSTKLLLLPAICSNNKILS
jgi:hypothetical protein